MTRWRSETSLAWLYTWFPIIFIGSAPSRCSEIWCPLPQRHPTSIYRQSFQRVKQRRLPNDVIYIYSLVLSTTYFQPSTIFNPTTREDNSLKIGWERKRLRTRLKASDSSGYSLRHSSMTRFSFICLTFTGILLLLFGDIRGLSMAFFTFCRRKNNN